MEISKIMLILNTFLINYRQPVPIKIDGPKNIRLAYYDIKSETEIYSYFNVTGLIDNFYFTPSINFNLLGENEYILHVENSYYFDDFKFVLNVYDDIPPIMNCIKQIIIKESKNNLFDSILEFCSAYDDFDGYVDVNIKDQNSTTLLLYSKDKSNNESTKEISIINSQINYGLYYETNLLISTYVGNELSAKKCVLELIKNGSLEKIDNFTANYYDQRNVNFNRCGKYKTTICLEYKKQKYDIDVLINVIEKEEKHYSIIEKIYQFLIWLKNKL